MQEVSLTFQSRDPDASGSQQLLSSLCTGCLGLRALKIWSCNRLRTGPLPAAFSRLHRLSVLLLHNVWVFGSQCLPPALPAIRRLTVCDQPAWAPAGSKLLYPASLARMTMMTSLTTSSLSFEGGLPVSLQS